MIVTTEDAIKIIKNNPNKEVVKFAQEQCEKMSKIVLGEKIEESIEQSSYFEHPDIYKERKKAITNKDLFSRILNKESMVFSSRGGTAIYEGLDEENN